MNIQKKVLLTANFELGEMELKNITMPTTLKYVYSGENGERGQLIDISVIKVSRKFLKKIFSTVFVNENYHVFKKSAEEIVKNAKEQAIKEHNEKSAELKNAVQNGIDKLNTEIKDFEEDNNNNNNNNNNNKEEEITGED